MAKKQKSGLYRARVKIGVDPDGTDIYKYVSARTRADLDRTRQAAVEYYILGTGLASDQLFGPYAQQWYRVRKSPGLSASSRESYRTALNRDILPVFALRHIRAIRPLDLQEFMSHFRGMSSTKITVVYAALNGIFLSACADRILERNPMEFVVKPEAAAPMEKRPLTLDERKRVEKVARRHPCGAYLAVLYYLGCRPGEARGLKWGDFDWSSGTVHIQRDIDYKAGGEAGKLKNKKSNRRVPVPPALKNILLPLRGDPDSYLFIGDVSGSPLSKTTAERKWVELMLACGLAEPVPKDSPKKFRPSDIRAQYVPLITPHVLRHNYITMCWEDGIDVYITQKLVGHASIKTTMDIYTHLSEAQLEKAGKLIRHMFDGGGSVQRNCNASENPPGSVLSKLVEK